MEQCKDFCPVTSDKFDVQEQQCKYFMKVNNIKLGDKCYMN